METEDCKLIQSSSERMYDLRDKSIHLIVTSPPYWNAIDYDRYIEDKYQNYKTRKGVDYKTYIGQLRKVFKECFRVLKRGRFCCVILSSVVFEKKTYSIPYDFVNLMTQIGFEFHQEIIWNKCKSYKPRIEATLKNLYPGNYYPNFIFEHILIFKKPNAYTPLFSDEDDKIPMSVFYPKDVLNNIWNILPVKYDCINHPYPFPEEIPYRLIQLYSYKGNKVLDPFMGSGTTGLVAKTLNRRFIGYETQEKFIELTKQRLEKPLFLRNQVLSNFFKLPRRFIKQEEW